MERDGEESEGDDEHHTSPNAHRGRVILVAVGVHPRLTFVAIVHALETEEGGVAAGYAFLSSPEVV